MQAEPGECDDGSQCHKVRIDFKINAKRSRDDDEYDPEDKSTHFLKKTVPLFAIAVGPAYKQIDVLAEIDASRVTLTGHLESVDPMWIEGVDEPCILMTCLKATAASAGSAEEFWGKKPKAPTYTALPKDPALIRKGGPNDAIPF